VGRFERKRGTARALDHPRMSRDLPLTHRGRAILVASVGDASGMWESGSRTHLHDGLGLAAGDARTEDGLHAGIGVDVARHDDTFVRCDTGVETRS
jgi:hypothetical protein